VLSRGTRVASLGRNSQGAPRGVGVPAGWGGYQRELAASDNINMFSHVIR
jgi:hypothetical protein